MIQETKCSVTSNMPTPLAILFMGLNLLVRIEPRLKKGAIKDFKKGNALLKNGIEYNLIVKSNGDYCY